MGVPKTAKDKRLYEIWKGMRARCNNPNHSSFDRYGGRGICIDEEWDDYVRFELWSLSNGYASDLTIDRIDNDDNYSPKNCRWVTRKVNTNNTSRNINLLIFGETKTVAEWSEDIRCAVHANTLYQRIEAGWNTEKALITPSTMRGKRPKKLSHDCYQAIANSTALYPGKGGPEGLMYVALGLAAESGELAGKLAKIIRDKNGIIAESDRQELIAELGDILWFIAQTCTELGISMDEVAQLNLDKLADRMERNVIGGSGDNR